MDRLYIVMYHYTRDLVNSRYPNIKGLEFTMFKEQLDFFKKEFNVVTMEQVIDAWNTEHGSLPENALLLTFDDGYIDNYIYAFPALTERGMQGSFFIPGRTFTENVLLDVNKIHFILASASVNQILTALYRLLDEYRLDGGYADNAELFRNYGVAKRFDSREIVFIKQMLQTVLPENIRKKIVDELFREFVGISEEKFSRELYMNREQIRLMKKRGMFIGIHGYNHYWLGSLNERKMQQEIDKALDVMDEFINKDSWVLNYPYGDYSKELLRYIELKGCRLGMTTDVRVAQVGFDDKYLLPRFDCNDFPPKSNNYRHWFENSLKETGNE